VVAGVDAFFELLQPSRPTEATMATDTKAARLRGTDMPGPPYMEMKLRVDASDGTDCAIRSGITLSSRP
jgi:hypothetical protein